MNEEKRLHRDRLYYVAFKDTGKRVTDALTYLHEKGMMDLMRSMTGRNDPARGMTYKAIVPEICVTHLQNYGSERVNFEVAPYVAEDHADWHITFSGETDAIAKALRPLKGEWTVSSRLVGADEARRATSILKRLGLPFTLKPLLQDDDDDLLDDDD